MFILRFVCITNTYLLHSYLLNNCANDPFDRNKSRVVIKAGPLERSKTDRHKAIAANNNIGRKSSIYAFIVAIIMLSVTAMLPTAVTTTESKAIFPYKKNTPCINE
ncbi:hypothetical protein GCM10020331_074680 [Ectobacillus funiculus]